MGDRETGALGGRAGCAGINRAVLRDPTSWAAVDGTAESKPGETTPNPNEGMLQAIKEGSRLERKDKRGIPCSHLFTGSGNAATELLLFFPRGADPITVADKLVTLESRFAVFHLSVKFPLKEMMYKGELAL